MLARRMMRRLRSSSSVVLPPDPPPAFGDVTSNFGGLYESYRDPTRGDALRLREIFRRYSPAAAHEYIRFGSYSRDGKKGFACTPTDGGNFPTVRFVKVDEDRNVVSSRNLTLAGSVGSASDFIGFQCLEDRIVAIAKGREVRSYAWDGGFLGAITLPDDIDTDWVVNEWPEGRLFSPDGVSAMQIGRIWGECLDNRRFMTCRSGSRYFWPVQVPLSLLDKSIYLLRFDQPDGPAVEVPFNWYGFDVDPPAGADEAPVYAWNRRCKVHESVNVGGEQYVLATAFASEFRWDGTTRLTPIRVGRASLSQKTTEFIGRVAPDGGFSVVRVLSRTSWWYDMQDFHVLSGVDGPNLFDYGGGWTSDPEYSGPRTRVYHPDNGNVFGLPPVEIPGISPGQTDGPLGDHLSWQVLPRLTFIDKDIKSLVFREGDWDSGKFWRVGAGGATPLTVDIPPGGSSEADVIDILEREQAWILRRGSFFAFERSANTGQEFEPNNLLAGGQTALRWHSF